MKSLTPLTTDHIFTQQQYDGMDNEEKMFAQQQLRQIFSKEMSKVSASLSKKKKVEENVAKLQNQLEYTQQKRIDDLNLKMEHVEVSRRKNLNKRIEACKQHDDNWKLRVKEINARMRQEERDATLKALAYKKSIEESIHNRRSKTQASATHNNGLHASTVETTHDKYILDSYRPDTIMTVQNQKTPRQKERVKTSIIDDTIREHQSKHRQLQQKKEEETLQRVVGRLQHINERRSIRLKQSERIKTDQEGVERGRKQSLSRETPEKKEAPRAVINSMQKTLERTLKPADHSHLDKKAQKEREESTERWNEFVRNQKKSRREQIVRLIKDKVSEYKLLAQRF